MPAGKAIYCALCVVWCLATPGFARSLPLVAAAAAAAAAAALSLSLLLLLLRLLSPLLLLLLLLPPLLLLHRHRHERQRHRQRDREMDTRETDQRDQREEKAACLKGLHLLLVINSFHPVHSNHLTAQYCSPQRTKLLKPCAASERQYSCPAGPLRRKWLVCTNNSCKIGVLKSTGRKARGPS